MDKPTGPDDNSSDSLVALVHAIGDGDQWAMAELWQRLGPYLKRRIAGLIADRHQAVIDKSEAANEAFLQFVEQCQQDRVEIDDRHDLYALLGTIVIRRLVDQVRRADAKKRQPRHQKSAEAIDSAIPSDSQLSAWLEALEAEEGFAASPDDVLGAGCAISEPVPMARERNVSHPIDADASDSQASRPSLERLLVDFDPFLNAVFRETIDALPEDLRAVFDLLYVHKKTEHEAADELDISPKLVRRKIESIREAFSHLNCDSTIERTARRRRTRRSP